MAILFSQLAGITGGALVQVHSDQQLSHLLIDSRKLSKALGAVFFAINGIHHNGHDFIDMAYESGIRQFIVNEGYQFNPLLLEKCNILVVQDPVKALQQITAYHRDQFNLKVIAITGSNGKTIVKEWLSQILARNFKVVKSPKSYNSQIGVPLSAWQITDDDEIGVFEAGISQPGEMANLESILKPDIGIFTNIGPAHAEGFVSIDQKVDEKLQLFKNCPHVIYCADHTRFAEIIEKKKTQFSNTEFVSWSAQGIKANFNFDINNNDVTLQSSDLSVNVNANDPVSLENLLHCIVASQLLGMASEKVKDGIVHLTPVEMRLELKKGMFGCYLIDDSYNNDLASLEIAINFAHQQVASLPKTLILSDILQSGLQSSELYLEVNRLISSNQISRLIGIGKSIISEQDTFAIPAVFFSTTEDFLKTISKQKFENETIIVKGARSFRFERIVRAIQEKSHGTKLVVNLDAIVHNFNFYRKLLNPDTKIMVMVKALAYGGGSFEIGSLLSYYKADYLAVAYVDEGIELRSKGIKTPIMVMNPPPDSVESLIQYDLEPEIFSLLQLKSLIENIAEGASLKIHLKIETGMNRLGFQEEHIDDLFDRLTNAPNLKIGSIFSHLAASEDRKLDEFTQHQYDEFQRISQMIINRIGYQPLRHLLNSSGITRFPEMQLEMVRLGIGLYGISTEKNIHDQLMTVSTLQTTISQIRQINVGKSVGYGRAFFAEKDTMIATIAIGYADGYDRRFGNGIGKVLVNGKIAPVIGNICMDMSMIDITGIDASEGDDVIIFGNEPPVSSLSESIGTIPYEILAAIGSRVKRVFHSS
ncbi:MAG: bifunctional UDP-N-acetylmuramoyl-tripeptide:D-alanyl-D-alanine ligase/alanine racemase [Bacteroidetes bacterium]|nr:bifunctional UDP-N-acetylmuramoyl-tripeptide:D-alanyl-D-alanine ligase/alanine racemase [Bacteroidota bacterium]